jgi:hypothetical protein
MLRSAVAPDASPAQVERFEQFLAWLLPLTLGFAAVQAALLAVHGSATGGGSLVLTLGYAGMATFARHQARRRRLESALTFTCGGLLLVAVLGVLVTRPVYQRSLTLDVRPPPPTADLSLPAPENRPTRHFPLWKTHRPVSSG